MKAILYMDEGSKVVADMLLTPPRQERETQREYEDRITKVLNKSQPRSVHKIIKIKLLRN
mgnify:CR=1 FL=1